MNRHFHIQSTLMGFFSSLALLFLIIGYCGLQPVPTHSAMTTQKAPTATVVLVAAVTEKKIHLNRAESNKLHLDNEKEVINFCEAKTETVKLS